MPFNRDPDFSPFVRLSVFKSAYSESTRNINKINIFKNINTENENTSKYNLPTPIPRLEYLRGVPFNLTCEALTFVN